jgi:phospholipase A1
MDDSGGYKRALAGSRNPVICAALALVMLGTLVSIGLSAADSGSAGSDKAEEGKAKKLSYFTRLWDLDKETRGERHAITSHRSNYALVFSYNSSPNLAAVQEADPAKTLTKTEVTFQLSFKTRLWQDVFGKEMDLWFGYTQRSFWQLYNFADSSPFRETNYEPEVLLNLRTRFSVLGLQSRFIMVGLNHQSNGQSEPLSRSWNRIVAHIGLERGDFSLLLTGWYRIPENIEENDNPQTEKYFGYGEIWAYYFMKNHRLGIMLRNNLDFGTNRGALQLEWSFPLFGQVGGYVQYYLGYGESLLDYNHRVNRIGVGFILSDWN